MTADDVRLSLRPAAPLTASIGEWLRYRGLDLGRWLRRRQEAA